MYYFIVPCDGIVVPFRVFGLHVGTEPVSAPHPAHTATLPLSGRPHAHTGSHTHKHSLYFTPEVSLLLLLYVCNTGEVKLFSNTTQREVSLPSLGSGSRTPGLGLLLEH